jgi:hypothetical protein
MKDRNISVFLLFIQNNLFLKKTHNEQIDYRTNTPKTFFLFKDLLKPCRISAGIF